MKPTIPYGGFLISQTDPAEAHALTARLADGNVRLSWPTSAAGFRLQSATAVTGAYADDPAPAVVEGELNVVTVTPQGAAKFYRLAN